MAGRPAGAPLAVAVDTGPLHGPRTGVGVATAGIVSALADEPSVSVVPYVLSARAHLRPGTRRLPLPAAAAHRAWARAGLPRVDRWLRPAAVVHGTNYVVPPSRLPRLVTVYDCWFLRHPGEVVGDVRRAGQVLRRAVASGAVVHASSAATAAEVRELLHTDRVHVIPLGPPPLPTTPAVPAAMVPAADGYPGDPGDPAAGGSDRGRLVAGVAAQLGDRPFVLALGTMERRKNLPRLVAAFGAAASIAGGGRSAEARLVVAGGDGDDRPAIDAAIDALAPTVRERVHVVGRVGDVTKAWLLAHAAVLAYPSLDEGFGFPLLEAMQAGVPVVASTAGSIPEVAGDAALLVGPADTDALAGALARALDDDAERARLVAAGAARVQQFSWRTTAERLSALYHALAGGHA